MIIFKQYMIFMALLFAAIPMAFSDLEYTESGEFDNAYIRGAGIFNSGVDPVDDVDITPKVISDPVKTPLVNDLDGDGVQEIIVLSGNTVLILQNKTLATSSSILLEGSAFERFSNMITFDIDGDSLPEILLIAEKGEILNILNFSNVDGVQVQTLINLTPSITHDKFDIFLSPSGQFIIGCESTNRCLMAYVDEQVAFAGSTTDSIFVSFFNSTNVANERLALAGVSALNTFCTPKIRHMAKADYDQDGDVEFIFTFNEPDDSSGDHVQIFWVDILANNTPNVEVTAEATEPTDILTASPGVLSCDDPNAVVNFASAGGFGTPLAEKLFTSPLVYDADPSTFGLETIIGVMTDNNRYVLIMYDSTGTEIREFPFVQESEGQIISNVFRAEVFDDSSSETDFCVLAQNVGDGQITTTCGSLTDGDGFGLFNLQTIEFRLNATSPNNLFNVSDDFDFHGILTHSVEYDGTNSESEFLSSHGVFRPELDVGFLTQCFQTNDCEMSLIFVNPRTDGTVVPVDLDENNQEDLLVLTQTNLFYIDDGFANQGASEFCGEPNSVTGACSIYTTNPCLDSVWRLNTTVEITVTAADREGNLVASRVILYDGDSNELDSGFFANASSISATTTGTEVPFSFVANKTIAGGIMTIEIKDTENQDTVRTLTKSFSVAPSGVEFNDCKTEANKGVIEDGGVGEECDTTADCDGNLVCSFTGVCFDPDAPATVEQDQQDNAIITLLRSLGEISGLAGTSIWLIFMLALTAGIWFEGAKMSFGATTVLGAIAITNLLMIILGARLGILSTNLVVIVTILGILIIAVFLGRFLTGLRTEA